MDVSFVVQVRCDAEATGRPQLPVSAALDAVSYLRIVAQSLPALQQQTMPSNVIARLLALHIHLLRHLLPSVPVRTDPANPQPANQILWQPASLIF